MPLRIALSLLLFCAVVQTWPLASAPGTLSLNHNADAEFTAWLLSWTIRTIVRDPWHLFDGNIFAPEPHVLVYSDPLIFPALLGAPIRWLGGSPVLTFNIVVLTGLTATAWSGWLLAWRWTGSATAALCAGALMAFNVHQLARLPHVAAAHMWGIPLGLWLAEGLLRKHSRRRAVLLAIVVAATAATSAYTLAMLGLVVAVVMVAGLTLRRGRAVLTIGASACAGLVAAAPILWPYLRFGAQGANRPLSQVADFSATVTAYLTSSARVHAWWSPTPHVDELGVLFIGVTPLVLAAFGVVSARRGHARRRRLALLGVLAALAILLSFGPATAMYRLLYEWIPPLRGLRVAARFSYVALVAIAIAAAYGVLALERRFSSRYASLLIGITALVMVSVEVWSGPVQTRPFKGVPGIYRQLAARPEQQAEPVLLVEVPFFHVDTFWGNAEYVLASTAHWQPLMNGYSGYVPPSYRRRADAFWFFPEDWAIDAMRREGATHLMVHLERFTETEVVGIKETLARRQDVVLLATDATGHRLYRWR